MPQMSVLRPALAAVLLSFVMLGVLPALAQDKDDEGFSFGLTANNKATLRDVGLSLYPKAREHKESGDDSSTANLGLWTGKKGFRLVVLKYESDDSPAKVAEFYRKELGKYGKVVDCSDPASNRTESSGLTCKDDHPEPGSVLLKVGTKQKQHLVGIKPEGSRSVFQLIYLESNDSTVHYD